MVPVPASRSTWPERVLLACFLTLFLAGAWNFAFGGLDALGDLGLRVEDVAYRYATWQVEVYVWIFVPVLLVVSYFAQSCLPLISICVQGPDGESRVVDKWYVPGTFKRHDGWATWRELGGWASAEAEGVVRRKGLWLGVLGLRRRVKTAEGTYYEELPLEPYRSVTLHKRLQTELARNGAARRSRLLGANDDGH